MLRQKGKFKFVNGAGAFELEARAGESLLIRDIWVFNSTGTHVTLKIGQATVGYFRVTGSLGNHLPFPLGRAYHAHDWLMSATAAADQTSFASLTDAGGTEVAAKMIGGLAASTNYPNVGSKERSPASGQQTLLQFIIDLGLFPGYPVESGQTFIMTGHAQNGCYALCVYDEYDEGDMRRDMVNGSEASERVYVNYGNTGGSLTTAVYHDIDTAVNPSEFPDFPYGDDVPNGVVMTLHALCASSFAMHENDDTDAIGTQALRMIQNQNVLFDRDRVGLLCFDPTDLVGGTLDRVGEGYSVLGNLSDEDAQPPLLFNPPLEFGEGEELTLQWLPRLKGSAQTWVVADQEVGSILHSLRR